VVAYPTDTLYGLAVDPRSTRAVERLFEIKEREPGKAVPLIAASVEQASEAAIFDERARRVAESFWPGAL
jgi:L-threonylcarbamoyladenylate synthase